MAIFKAFLVTAITAATDYFLADYFHILKDLSIYYTIYHLLLIRGLCPSPSWKALLYNKTYDTSQKFNSWPICFIFLWTHCHLVNIQLKVVKVQPWQRGRIFLPKKQAEKMLWLCGPPGDKSEVAKSWHCSLKNSCPFWVKCWKWCFSSSSRTQGVRSWSRFFLGSDWIYFLRIWIPFLPIGRQISSICPKFLWKATDVSLPLSSFWCKCFATNKKEILLAVSLLN